MHKSITQFMMFMQILIQLNFKDQTIEEIEDRGQEDKEDTQ
jgi:hypothetical protein